MKNINIPVEISLLLDAADGVAVYINEDEHSSHSVSLNSLIDEWIDSYSNEQGIAPAHQEEAYAIIAQLGESIAILVSSLPQ